MRPLNRHTKKRSQRAHLPEEAPLSRGFSLLEVLVVVAILSLLIAILIPSLSGAREEAYRVKCMANLGQIVKAWHWYLDDHKGQFPQGVNMAFMYGGQRGGRATFRKPRPLNKYLQLPAEVSTAEVFQCPGDRADRAMFEFYGTSYQTNPLLVGKGINVPDSDPCLEMANERSKDLCRDDIRNTSRLILTGDFEWYQQWLMGEKEPWHGREDFFNIGFMDTHVRTIRIHEGKYADGNYTLLPFELQDCQDPDRFN